MSENKKLDLRESNVNSGCEGSLSGVIVQEAGSDEYWELFDMQERVKEGKRQYPLFENSKKIPAVQQKDIAIEFIELRSSKIASNLRCLWGYSEFNVYIRKLIIGGPSGSESDTEASFDHMMLNALLNLSDIHDDEFPDVEASLKVDWGRDNI